VEEYSSTTAYFKRNSLGIFARHSVAALTLIVTYLLGSKYISWITRPISYVLY